MNISARFRALALQLQIRAQKKNAVAEINAVHCRKIPLSGFENPLGFNRLRQFGKLKKEQAVKANQDLIGKTISGVVAVSQPGDSAREIWMLQFSDGTHVEFVSPSARRALRRKSRSRKAVVNRHSKELQLALNVA